jgi:hypothetical protein
MPISGAVAKRIEVGRIETRRPRSMPPLRPAKTPPFIARAYGRTAFRPGLAPHLTQAATAPPPFWGSDTKRAGAPVIEEAMASANQQRDRREPTAPFGSPHQPATPVGAAANKRCKIATLVENRL